MQHTWQVALPSECTWMPVLTPEDHTFDDYRASESRIDGKHNTRDEVREELRVAVRDKLGEYILSLSIYCVLNVHAAASTGKPGVQMHYAADNFVGIIVLREHRLVEGWPATIPFVDPGDIPGGAKTLRKLLHMWKEDKIRFIEASASDLCRARQDPRSVLPGTSRALSVRKRLRALSPEHIPGRLVLEPACLDVVVRPRSPPGPTVEDGARAPKRPRIAGQRRDNNSVRERRRAYPRHPRTGVKTARYVLDSDVSQTGMVVLDDDLGRAVEEDAFALV